MIRPAYVRTMARYNTWMNERLYACCARVPDADRREDVGAFFKSLHGTLNHLLVADRIWMGRFTGVPFAARSLDQELYAGFEELRAQREATDQDIERWAKALTDAELEGDITYMSLVDPAPRRYPMAFVVAHFFNHQAHHRGQLTTLLSQRGIDPGVTDLLWLPG
ncbi:MAG TPA: DinB family protein [Chloroflexota bacterium]|nr:DinB family protein [Chloroflexota bacterium]